jgi:HrpA-like RNA helicase
MQISAHLSKINALIAANAVVSVVAPTGSGKSVGIPAAVASTGARCFVTVPTRTAAISLAEYQRALQTASSPGIDANKLVGYAAEGNIKYGPQTLIAYVTGGHARKKMLSFFSNGKAKAIDFCDVLMVDEVHSGSLDTTIILSLWMTAAMSGVSVPRLVVASATPVPMTIQPTPVVYVVDIPGFPIEYRYLSTDVDHNDSEALFGKAAQITADIHNTTPISTGHVLVFAPGSNEVEAIARDLVRLIKPSDKIATIIPAFSSLKQEDIGLIYKTAAPNERKIIIATNIAEMSITVENIGHVVDTMIEKRAEMSQSGGFRLTTHSISKDSAKQRAGRTGRTRPGICYRLCTNATYEKLEQHRPPEIDRVPIYEPIMELMSAGLEPGEVIRGIDISRVVKTTQLLIKLGMVNYDKKVTEMGHFAPQFPLSVRNSAVLWHWIKHKKEDGKSYAIFPGVVVTALIDCYGPSYFWIPRKKPDVSPEQHAELVLAHKEKYFAKYVGYNDLESAINMWNDLTNAIGGIDGNVRDIARWCKNNSINNKKIRELLMIVGQIVSKLKQLGYNVVLGPFTAAGAIAAMRPFLLDVYSDSVMILNGTSNYYYNPATRDSYRLDTRDAVNGYSRKPPTGVIGLVTAEIETARGRSHFIGFSLDTSVDAAGRDIKPPATRGPRMSISRAKTDTEIVQDKTSQAEIDEGLDLLAQLALQRAPGGEATVGTETVVASTDGLTAISEADLLASLSLD